MTWNLRGGIEVRYQEELLACQGSETWVSGGEGEKKNLWTRLLGIPRRGETFPVLPLPAFSVPPLPLPLQGCVWEKNEQGVGGGEEFDPVLALLLSSCVTPDKSLYLSWPQYPCVNHMCWGGEQGKALGLFQV